MSVSCECCVLSSSGLSLVQRSPTESGVSECDHESPALTRPWPIRSCCAMVKKRENKRKADMKKETIDARLYSSWNEAECVS